MGKEINTEILKQFALFNLLNEADRKLLPSMLELQVKRRYSFIYLPGESSETVYFLAKGAVKLGTHNSEGKEVIKHLLHPDAMFGEMGLVGEIERQEFAQALKEDVHVYAMHVDNLKLLMSRNPELSARIMQLFGKRLMAAEQKLESIIFKDARTRIVDFIKQSVVQRGRKVGYEMLLQHSLTHQDIANVTCTSRQTVTLVLNELKKSDLIYFNRGKILVRDISRLV